MTNIRLADQTTSASERAFSICRFRSELCADFVRLNREWIEQLFTLEESDELLFADPKREVVDRGGEIFFAFADGKVVGCCALLRHDDGRFELAKLAVDAAFRGQGIGRRLCTSVMNFARSRGIWRLFIETNSRLEAAIALYHHLGFVETTAIERSHERGDVLLEADLSLPCPASRTALPLAQQRIALLISGGVDSAVALHLLCEQGLKPDLYYIKIGMEGEGMTCTAEEDIELSEATARRYGLRLQIVDLQRDYHERVVSYVVDRVRRGLTPNPDVMCNRLIKFGAFEERAGFAYDRIATGHYAQTLRTADGRTFLAPSPDPVKDQSDFLAQLDDFQVEKLLLPIGHMEKNEVRHIALEQRLPSARRHDSQGICFLGKINYSDFLRQLLGEKEGDVVELETGNIVGHHHGYWFHTIGQRKGLGLGGGPWFVVKKDIERNIVYVSHGYDTRKQYGKTFFLADFHFLTSDPWDGAAETPIRFKIRHTETPVDGHLTRLPDGTFRIDAAHELQGIAPGQFGVLYTADGKVCAGSGEISVGAKEG